MGDETADLRPVVGEVVLVQGVVFGGLGIYAVVPVVERDVLLGVLAGFGVDVFEQALQRPISA